MSPWIGRGTKRGLPRGAPMDQCRSGDFRLARDSTSGTLHLLKHAVSDGRFPDGIRPSHMVLAWEWIRLACEISIFQLDLSLEPITV